MTETAQIAADEDGIRLDRWFKRRYPALTHGRLEKLLRTGQVRLDGKRAKSADRVAVGQSVRVPPQVANDTVEEKPRPQPRAEDRQLLQDLILYMDKSVIVLNKPAGLATQGGSGLTRHIDGMLDQLAFEKNQRPRLVHRLDRDTSGVLVIARTVPAAAALARSLAQRDASKIYWALTRGVPQQKRGTIKAALAKEGARGAERMEIVERDSDDAKHAITDYAVVDRAGEEFAWVAAKPVTGRTHQIRVHLASLGTPIVGDFKYGAQDARGKGGFTGGLTANGDKLLWKSTEHNIDSYALFRMLGDKTDAAHALRFVKAMWSRRGGYYFIGTGTDGKTINHDDPTPEDVQTWSFLATGFEKHKGSIDWALANLSATSGGFSGLSFEVRDRTGVWFEGTAHAAAALEARATGDDLNAAQLLLNDIEIGQISAPNADGNGIDAASKDGLKTDDNGDVYYAALHTGATGWYCIAKQNGNPFKLK